MVVQGEKKFALLLAAWDSDYVKKVYDGYYNVFVEALGDNDIGEIWDSFRVVEGEFPSMDEVEKYEGFVISGSPHDAYGNEDWVLHLCLLVQTLFAMQKKLLGICFGHQILCRSLGGQVGRSPSGWDIGVRQVNLNQDFYSSFGVFNETFPSNLSIIQCHQDEVWEVPEGAQVIGFSNKTRVEMFVLGDCVMGIQGHPEYTKDILNSLVDRLLSSNCIDIKFGEEAKTQIKEAKIDRECWQKICKSFLKREIINISSSQLSTYF